MSAINLHSSHAPVARRGRRDALDALADAAHWVFAALGEWRRRARERGELARLDCRTLRDIGLSRAEAEFIVNKPFWRA
ncbi:MAG TPA: DUF1127 domain-containing protein [Stellaceae bacterium]|nr:DUF1127 domain-containing protein [Stellaceae bacterium]